jgi:lipopolysaccharide transport system permease protein
MQWLLALNPMSGLIESFRRALIPGLGFRWDLLGFSGLLLAGMFVIALAYFRRTEREFADIV